MLTFPSQGQLITTESAVQPANDGIVIMPDGTQYVRSVRQGGVWRIRPGQPAEQIATGIRMPSDVLRRGREPAGDPNNPNNAFAFGPSNKSTPIDQLLGSRGVHWLPAPMGRSELRVLLGG